MCECCASIWQEVISSVSGLYVRRGLWRERQALLVRLQAVSRGFLLRRQLQARRRYLVDHTPAVLVIQVRRWKLLLQQLHSPAGLTLSASPVCSGSLEEVCPAEGVPTQATVSPHELESCCQGNHSNHALEPARAEGIKVKF